MIGRYKKSILAFTLNALLSGAAASAICDAGESCGHHQPPGDEQPNPPGEPTPRGSLVDLYPAMLMNFESLPNSQIHMEGWWDCANGDPLGDYDADWCPQVPQPRTRGAWHKYVAMDNGARRPSCDTEIVFTKSPWGGGMETHCAYPDRVAIHEEELTWDRNGRWRNFEDDRGRPGSIWVRRGVQAGQFYVEGGEQHFRTCSDVQASVADYPLLNTWTIYGPYDISTPEGVSAAQRELAPFTAPGYDPVEPAWKTFNTQIPGGKPSDHVFIWLRADGWGLKPGYDPHNTLALAQLAPWSMTESYTYGAVGASPQDLKRGLGMIAWRARKDDGANGYRFVRQVVFDRVVQEANPHMQYGTCENTPTVPGAGIMSSQSEPWRVENRAERAYDWGWLPPDGLSERDRRQLEHRYRPFE